VLAVLFFKMNRASQRSLDTVKKITDVALLFGYGCPEAVGKLRHPSEVLGVCPIGDSLRLDVQHPAAGMACVAGLQPTAK
jgi:hypothetical protein